ncbi:MAG: hypothetical protein ACRC6B_09525, partial [Fusobacteriaceae bacterium]
IMNLQSFADTKRNEKIPLFSSSKNMTNTTELDSFSGGNVTMQVYGIADYMNTNNYDFDKARFIIVNPDNSVLVYCNCKSMLTGLSYEEESNKYNYDVQYGYTVYYDGRVL